MIFIYKKHSVYIFEGFYLVLVWLPQRPPQVPTPNTAGHVETRVFRDKQSLKVPLLKHILHVQDLLVRSCTYLTVGEPSKGSFCLCWLKELDDGGEPWRRQQHSAQRAMRREELLQLRHRHSSWKILHQDHSCAPRCCRLYTREENNTCRKQLWSK